MEKIVIITGSLRKNSNSMIMADTFEKAVNKNGVEVVRIDATKLDIGPCHGCLTCYSTGKACTFDDDFNKIADEILSADGIVISCPVYWYTMPAKVKALIDKFYSFYETNRLFKGKKCALLSSCEAIEQSTFDGINFAFDESFKLLEAEIVGKVEIAGLKEAGGVCKTNRESEIEKLAELFIK